MLNDLNIAVIGAGTMGEAAIAGLLRAELVVPERILAATPRPERRRELEQRWQINVTG
ncbi:MAG: NAD(P)-binding domain-containing protein, partial [Herpetosiphon sp.]|nr:NAD(P)-binding domain-containing protein [Herpetosiphon sp.]